MIIFETHNTIFFVRFPSQLVNCRTVCVCVCLKVSLWYFIGAISWMCSTKERENQTTTLMFFFFLLCFVSWPAQTNIFASFSLIYTVIGITWCLLACNLSSHDSSSHRQFQTCVIERTICRLREWKFLRTQSLWLFVVGAVIIYSLVLHNSCFTVCCVFKRRCRQITKFLER